MSDTPSFRLRYLPLAEARPGMVMQNPLVLTENGVVRYTLPAGHELTDGNLDQIQRKYPADIISILEPDRRTEKQKEDASKAAETRLEKIFELANFRDLLVCSLYNALLDFRRHS